MWALLLLIFLTAATLSTAGSAEWSEARRTQVALVVVVVFVGVAGMRLAMARTRFGRKDRTPLAFQRPHATVRIDGYDQHVSFPASPLKISGVSDVQHVKAAVRQHHALSAIFVRAQLRRQFFEGNNLISRVHLRLQRACFPHRIESRLPILRA